MACVPVLGRLHTAAVFLLDDCMRPIYGEGTGFIDDCFAAFSSSDNMDDGETFTRRCANGRILYHEEGEQALQSVEINLDLNAEPDGEWAAKAGLVQPVMNGAKQIGWTRCTSSTANVLVLLWQEVLGGDGCDPDESSGGWRLHAYPIRKARLTTEGNIGAEDGYIRLTGRTVEKADLGKGPIPLLTDGGGDPVYPDDDLDVCHHTVLTDDVAPPPADCGVVDTVEPEGF